MASEIASEEDQDKTAVAKHAGTDPDVRRSGHIILARECARALETAYDRAFLAWAELHEAETRQRAAA